MMTASAKDKLFTLLFGGERELINLKFCPGKGATEDTLFDAAQSAIAQALADESQDMPPSSGRARMTLRELVSVG